MKTALAAGMAILLAAGGVSDGAEPSPPAPVARAGEGTAPAPPSELEAADHPLDDGERIDLCWRLAPDEPAKVALYKVYRSGEEDGLYAEAGLAVPGPRDRQEGVMRYTVEKCRRGEPYWFRVSAVGQDGAESDFIQAGPATAARQALAGDRLWLALFVVVFCGAVVFWIAHARRGRDLRIRKIAGLEAVDEAVGRATEMGRPCLFVPGIQDMNDIQTIAGLTVLGRVAQTAAEYGARVKVPTSRALVMTAARETVETSYLTAGRPDAYREDDIYYVTDEQFGYVAHLTGLMVRERPAACFYLGSFYAESLIVAETGNSIGAIQVAGTAQPEQLPFFVAACDYTLIGEEFFAASAYLSGDAEQLGSLKGQDLGKLITGVLLIAGCGLATLAAVAGSPTLQRAVDYLRETVLR